MSVISSELHTYGMPYVNLQLPLHAIKTQLIDFFYEPHYNHFQFSLPMFISLCLSLL